MVTVSKSSNVSIIKTHKVMTQKYHISISAVHCEIKSWNIICSGNATDYGVVGNNMIMYYKKQYSHT